MRIRPVPGGTEICLDCGAHAFQIDPIQHEPLCQETAEEMEWQPVGAIDEIPTFCVRTD